MSSRLMCQITTDRISGFAEDVYDLVAAILAAGTNVTLTPDDGTNTVTIAASGGGGGGGVSLSAANTWTAQQTFEVGAAGASPVIFRQTGGTAGVDEVQVSHDGTNGKVESKSGKLYIGSSGSCYEDTLGGFVVDGSRGVQDSAFTVQYGSNMNAGDIWTLNWRSASSWYGGAQDLRLGRAAAGVLSLGDAGAGNDPGLRLTRKSSTTDGRTLGALKGAWSDSTDATRKADMVLLTDGYNGPHEALRCHDTGSSAQVILPVASVPDAADDSIASGLSPAVPVGGLYRTGNALKIRLA